MCCNNYNEMQRGEWITKKGGTIIRLAVKGFTAVPAHFFLSFFSGKVRTPYLLCQDSSCSVLRKKKKFSASPVEQVSLL